MLCAGGWSFRGISGAGGGAQRSAPSALSYRPVILRAPVFHNQPSHLYRTLGAPQLTVVNVARHNDWPAASAGPRSFEQLGLQTPLVSALYGMGITEPTDIQSISIPALMNQPGNYFLASHTGSGKTLAYLLPLVQALKQEEASGFVPRPKRPRVLVLGPTRELTDQITGVAKKLCHTVKFRATCANADTSISQQARAMSGPIDVLVATPTRFLHHIKEGNVAYRDIRWLVVDEADTVFGQGWGEEVAAILAPLRSKPDPAHVLLRAIRELVPDAKELKTSTLHRAVSGSSHQFMTLPPGGNKLQLLAEILGADNRRAQKVLVFCNTVDSCRAVEHFAREEGLPCVCYHGEMPSEERQESMATFAAAVAGGGARLPIMIATDLAARGLDFPGTVDHVVNFDFPTTSVDYLHRTGRTARAGNTGAWRIATRQKEKANIKVREAEAVLGAKGMAKLRAATAARAAKRAGGSKAETGTGPGGKLRLRGSSASKASEKAAAAKPALRGPVRGAARFALMEERLQRRNVERGKGRPGGGGGGGSRAARGSGGGKGGKGGR
ncbi:hypothetical protein VOLCADRAFT_121417 [Volvox carteri f. nagariensis]|uniref:DEAD-box RNA helicase n=1 Tax=Volvox carteri f. nagariensis TaxID=3068 RepID=D8U9N9_VOLCA|nr:uncharacterized protein VOLCADRAFT_121417 [Volvox carteri f. nagariensis]EFJ43504.1 hypothetical protein VOLCADRAFT_121417 [Volvox carteri f. nagariensis]|eukprot:XP_002955433.1 hypothetical protein VOLCADRAFT_121417 [Volvox carteri f. nagariensis]